MIHLISGIALVIPILFQILVLLRYSPAVSGRAAWKWGVIFGLNFVQSGLMELLIFLIVYALTNMYYVSLGVVMLLFLIFDFINWQILKERTMIFLPMDLAMIKGIKELIGMVGVRLLSIAVVASSIFIFVSVLFQQTFVSPSLGIMWRVVIFFSAVLLLVQFKWVNHPSYIFFKIFRFHWKDHAYHFNQIFGAQFNGFFLQFFVNIDLTIMDKPKGYSLTKMKNIYEKYSSAALKTNILRSKKQNNERVIVVLSESLSDPEILEEIKLHTDVLPNLHRPSRNRISFKMASGFVGGGTANIEYEVYTGFSNALFNPSMTTPYAHVVPNMQYTNSITDYFDIKIGVHNFTGNLYQRDLVYNRFGFQKFYTTNSLEFPIKHTEKYAFGKYISDDQFFEELEDVINSNPEANLISGISMQNHMPFLSEAGQKTLVDTGTLNVNMEEYDSYLTGIKYTDSAIDNFLHKMQLDSIPTTVLLYGDHLPNIFSKIDAEGQHPELRLTPGFIWQNTAADKMSPLLRFNQEDSVYGSNVLVPLLFKSKNWKISPYYELLTQVMEKLPAIVNEILPQSKLGFMTNKYILETQAVLNSEQIDLLNDYMLVQYDQTAGEQLMNRAFFELQD